MGIQQNHCPNFKQRFKNKYQYIFANVYNISASVTSFLTISSHPGNISVIAISYSGPFCAPAIVAVGVFTTCFTGSLAVLRHPVNISVLTVSKTCPKVTRFITAVGVFTALATGLLAVLYHPDDI